MIKNIVNIPTKNDWGDLSNPDIYYAYKAFGEKNNENIQAEFKKNIIERCNDLKVMPIKPFLYYIFGLKKFIENGDFGLYSEACDSVNGFLSVIESKLNENPKEIKRIYPKIKTTLNDIAKNQNSYDADEEIYGDFKVVVRDIDIQINLIG